MELIKIIASYMAGITFAWLLYGLVNLVFDEIKNKDK